MPAKKKRVLVVDDEAVVRALVVRKMRKTSPPASDAEIAEAAGALAVEFPASYVALLKLSNGVEGPVSPKQHLVIWSTAELVTANDGYKVRQYAPTLWLFGTNMGGAGYGFHRKTGKVVDVPLAPLDADDAMPLADDFHGFLVRMMRNS